MLAVWLLALVLIRVLSAAQFLEAGIERAEVRAGVCLSIDPECSIDHNGEVDLGDAPSNELNLMSHLIGSAIATDLGATRSWHLLSTVSACLLPMPLWLFAAQIFHPPRSLTPRH